MILPSDADPKHDTEEQLITKLRRVGYSAGAAKYIAGKLKGRIKDDQPIV